MSNSGWYKDAIFYELRIRSFFDSDGDGVGDIRGVTEKLDYLHDLGVTALWLLPFYPSPGRDDGYDIADYLGVHPAVGKLKDFRAFVRAAHDRGLRVVTELVLNHTSDQHAWFQRARRAPPGSREREFYVWSDSTERYADARIIFTDYETSNWTWDPVAKAHYWHRFFSHQPDLNFESKHVQKAMYAAVDFWLEMGVDGLRLDAVPYLFERDGTNCENLPETHGFLRDLRRHVDRKFNDRMLLAEANQWPEDAVAYFGDSDECHMAFHFPIMPRLYLALRMEDSFPILDILEQTPEIPAVAQWAIFLRNHDELTLEMVSEEERDLMLRAYAREQQMRINVGIRRRLCPLLDNNRRRIELMNALLFSLPGSPVIYYGDEIGMGDNVYLGDRNGVRTPMQWSPDRNAGFSRANPQSLILPPIVDPEYHYETINVENQQRNPSSLLWWTKRIIALRKQHPAFGRGTFEPLAPSNRSVLAFIRRHEGDTLLVVANLSRFTQFVRLDLGAFRGREPVELFGRVRFPPIGAGSYRLSLGPHDFFWFSLEEPPSGAATEDEYQPAALSVRSGNLFETRRRSPALEAALGRFLASQRWYRRKSHELKSVRVLDAPALGPSDERRLLFVEATFSKGDPEVYVLVVLVRSPAADDKVIARLGDTALVEVSDDPDTAARLLQITSGKKRIASQLGEITGVPTKELRARKGEPPRARRMAVEQSNTCFFFGDELVGKLSRKLDEGRSTEVEMLRELAPRASELAVPTLLGTLELAGTGATLVTFTNFIANQGDAWRYTLDELERFFERVITTRPAELDEDLARGYLEAVRLLGRRTAELHLALAQSTHPDFVPTSFSALARRATYQAMRTSAVRTFELLRRLAPSLPKEIQPLARSVAKRRRSADKILRALIERPLGGKLIRVHGDLHLGQVLYTGRDFAIIDFEGEPARALADRRRRRSPLVDVAGMLRSFQYAAGTALALPRQEDIEHLRRWTKAWYGWASRAYVDGYFEASAGSTLVPRQARDFQALLDACLVEKALYEVAYELDNRPTWVGVPLAGLADLLT